MPSFMYPNLKYSDRPKPAGRVQVKLYAETASAKKPLNRSTSLTRTLTPSSTGVGGPSHEKVMLEPWEVNVVVAAVVQSA